MILNEYGTIAHNECMATTIIRPNVTLGEFLTMPNHMHGIIILHVMGASHSPPKSPSQTIGAIIRAYKSAVTKQLHNLKMDCAIWQRNYYEHIIRDELSYQRISN
jgi:putative transposase